MGKALRLVRLLIRLALWPLRVLGLISDISTAWSFREYVVTAALALAGAIPSLYAFVRQEYSLPVVLLATAGVFFGILYIVAGVIQVAPRISRRWHSWTQGRPRSSRHNTSPAFNDSLDDPTVGTLTVRAWPDTHPWIQEDEMNEGVIEQRSIHIADFGRRMRVGGRSGVVLSQRIFDNCHIYGSAILVPLDSDEVGGKVFVRCQRLTQEDAFWLSPDNPTEQAGTVRLEDCLFRNCICTEIGIVGSPERHGEVPEYRAGS